MRHPYTADQLRALLAAAEYQWAHADWASAGQWKRSIHALRDRLAMVQA